MKRGIPNGTNKRNEWGITETFYGREWDRHPLIISAKVCDEEFLLLEMWKYKKDLRRMNHQGKAFWKLIIDTDSARVVAELLRLMRPNDGELDEMLRYVMERRKRMPYLKGIDEVLEVLEANVESRPNKAFVG